MRCKLDSLELNGRGAAQWFQITKNPPKMRFIKFVKVNYHTSTSNSLTNFESEVHAMTGNGNQVTLLKITWQNS